MTSIGTQYPAIRIARPTKMPAIEAPVRIETPERETVGVPV